MYILNIILEVKSGIYIFELRRLTALKIPSNQPPISSRYSLDLIYLEFLDIVFHRGNVARVLLLFSRLPFAFML